MVRKRNVVVIAISGLATLILGGTILASSEEGGSNWRPPQVTREEARSELDHLEGELNIFGPDEVDASPSDPNSLEKHGVYRLVPAGYVGELPYDAVEEVPEGEQSDDPEVVEASPLYREVTGLPEGYERVAIDTFDGHTENAARQVFASEHRPGSIEVARVRRGIEPVDMFLPAEDGSSVLTVELLNIDGAEAVLYRAAPGEPEDHLVQLRFFEDGVDTGITATGVTVDEVLALAGGAAPSTAANERANPPQLQSRGT